MPTIKSKLVELTQEMKETNKRISELTAQMAVNTHVLQEHHKRSNMLEAGMMPLLEDLKHRQKLWTLTMGSSGLVAFVSIILAALAIALKH